MSANNQNDPEDLAVDEELLQKIHSQDHQTFSRLLEQYGNRMLRSAFCMSRNQAEAEDLVQETFLQAFKTADRFKGRSKIYTWLYGIMLNCFRAKRRKKKYHVDIDNVAEIESPPLIVKEATKIEVIHDAINSLDKDQATIIKLRYFENKTIEEIANILEISKGTVKSRLHYAREKIKDKKNVMDLLHL